MHPGRLRVSELPEGIDDPQPGRHALGCVNVRRELVGRVRRVPLRKRERPLDLLLSTAVFPSPRQIPRRLPELALCLTLPVTHRAASECSEPLRTWPDGKHWLGRRLDVCPKRLCGRGQVHRGCRRRGQFRTRAQSAPRGERWRPQLPGHVQCAGFIARVDAGEFAAWLDLFMTPWWREPDSNLYGAFPVK